MVNNPVGEPIEDMPTQKSPGVIVAQLRGIWKEHNSSDMLDAAEAEGALFSHDLSVGARTET